jgi:ubiquinone/menaquinone biosynthesis C-methylase UbiE
LKILDVGCGAGSKTKMLKKIFPGFTFLGCDVSKKAINYANKNSSGIKFFVANAQKLPIGTNSIDVVIAQSVLDHLESPEKGMSEVYRVLKKGGTFLFTDPLEAGTLTIHSFFTRFIPGFREMRKNRLGHTIAFSEKDLLKMAKKDGFRIVTRTIDWFYFKQIVDIVYYPFLMFFGKGPEFTVDKLISNKKTFTSKFLDILRSLEAFIENLESELMRGFPYGFFIYVRAKK